MVDQQTDKAQRRKRDRTIFFFIAASAFASAFASFFAESFSSFVCASKLSAPTFACSASNSVSSRQIRSRSSELKESLRTIRIIFVEQIRVFLL